MGCFSNWFWPAPSSLSLSGKIIKEGWLYKRGKYLKTWRLRFFLLLDNGSLIGFKYKPNVPYGAPRHNLPVKNCQITKLDRPKLSIFVIGGLTFQAKNDADREEWVAAIKAVSDNLADSQDVEVMERAGSINRKKKDIVKTDKLAQTSTESRVLIASSHTFLVELKCSFQTADRAIKAVSDKLADSQDVEVMEKAGSINSVGCSLGGSVTSSNPAGGKKLTLENFELLKVLGKGSMGKVILCREKATGNIGAVKVLKKEDIIKKDMVSQTLTENRVLKTTSHPFLVDLKYSFQTADRLCFVMEYVNGGELFFYLFRLTSFSENDTRFYGAEIISALRYLHSEGIIYRDLKLENVLLDKEGHIKITDFGSCKEDITYGRTTKTFCGTPAYLAPEVLDYKGYGRAVDWWGVGMVMYDMMCGSLPFYNEDHKILFHLILEADVTFQKHVSSDAKDMLTGLLMKDPNKRLGGGPEDSKEIIDHPFFSCINWCDLESKRPEVTSDTDTRYFDSEFTEASVELTIPENAGLLKSIAEDFTQFSYQEHY